MRPIFYPVKFACFFIALAIIIPLFCKSPYENENETLNNTESKYLNYEDVENNEVLGKDYEINYLGKNKDISIIAIHGGKIESGTSEIARIVAEMGNYSFYEFKGIKSNGNSSLHVTSVNFDEPVCVNAVSKSKFTVSIHGCAESEPVIYIGGLDKKMGKCIKKRLELCGFIVEYPPVDLEGKMEQNITNRKLTN